MLIAIALAAASATPVWTFRMQTDLLRQPEAIAELAETPDAPGRYLRFSCSVMSGPVLEIGLGQRSFEEFSRFSANGADTREPIALTVQPAAGGLISLTARRVDAQVTAHAYATGGGEAVAVAQAVAAATTVTISSPEARVSFDVSGAQSAINQVLDACPFKG